MSIIVINDWISRIEENLNIFKDFQVAYLSPTGKKVLKNNKAMKITTYKNFIRKITSHEGIIKKLIEAKVINIIDDGYENEIEKKYIVYHQKETVND